MIKTGHGNVYSWQRSWCKPRPLTLPSPARGEGEHYEIEKEIPSPLRGEGEGGGDLRDYFMPRVGT
jgi:hypothetical protein